MKQILFAGLLLGLLSCRPQQSPLPQGAVVDSLVVYKSKRQLLVFEKRKLLKIYLVRLGNAPIGQKHFEGDERTPEGCYTINNRNANSSYHKNLGISYPTEAQRAFAKSQDKTPGGDVKIHGTPNKTRLPSWTFSFHDWTNGCIAVSNEEIDELFRSVKPGAPICIFP